ncbi:MAG: hypothetical protein ACE5JA_11580 [bacterium]
MILDEVYHDELTDSTLQELKNIGRWFNTLYGNYPTIIGGWAVWLYNPLGYGSRDIDLLFPERRTKERLANQYLSANGYILKKQSPFEEQFVKVVETSRGNEEIYLDACSVEDTNRVRGTSVEIPWALAIRNSELMDLKGLKFYVPRPEILIMLKAKAALDREHDRKRAYDAYYLDSKIVKDYYDVVSLLKVCDFDSRLLNESLESTDFKGMFLDVVERVVDKTDILSSHELDKEEMRGRIGELELQ